VDDKHITTIDGQGVALAALQALYRASLEQEKRLRALEAENEQLKQELAEQVGSLEAELAALKAAFEGQNGIKLAAATNAGVASGAK
jgi:DNA-binding transcriptional MerR regulator